MGKKDISSSIILKLAVVSICSTIFQSVLLASLMAQGGVLKQAEANRYRFFSEKVNGRNNNLENQMKDIQTDLDYDMEQISQLFKTEAGAKQVSQIPEEMAPLVMGVVLRTRATGAFLVIPGQGEGTDHSLSALYFRDNDPDRSGRRDPDPYILVGPWNVAEKVQIATTADRSFRLNMVDSNQAFAIKPCEAAREMGKPKWLGHWSPPLEINSQDEKVITYSTPLFRVDGNAKAVFGVKISVDYLYHLLPAFDLQAASTHRYVPEIRDKEGQLRAAVTHGAVQERMLEGGEPLDLTSADQGNSAYRLINHKNSKEISIYLSPVRIYYYNTPFENEEWHVIGLIERLILPQPPEKIERILNCSFLVPIVTGFITAVITSQWPTKYARLIELSRFPVDVLGIGSYSGQIYMTNQILCLFNLTREQERKFSRGKNQFIAFSEELKSPESGEEGVHKMGTEGEHRWIKITRKNSEGPVYCMMGGMADGVFQTKTLKKERDRDELTEVRNCMAFGTAMEWIKGRLDETSVRALVICDLNDLKGVNNAFGRDKRGKYIHAAASVIRGSFLRGQVSRTGGDEFTIILSGVSSQEVEEGVQVLRCTMGEYSSRCNFDVSVAAGTAFYDPVLNSDLEGTLNKADMGMYASRRKMKAQGAERIIGWTGRMGSTQTALWLLSSAVER